MKKDIFIGLIIGGMVSCNNGTDDIILDSDIEQQEPGDDVGYFISIGGTKNNKDFLSRNYWEEDENKKLRFFWEDSNSEMKSFVFDNETPLDFVNGMKYTDVEVIADREIRNNCKLRFLTGLETEFKDGYVIWSVSPIDRENIINETEISLSMPTSFVFNPSYKNITKHLKNFMYMSGTGIVSDDKAMVNFDVIPALLIFKLINKDTDVLNISNVSLTGPFNNKCIIKYDIVAKNISYIYTNENKLHSIKVESSEDVSVKPSEDVRLYSLVFPTKISNEDITLEINCNYGDLKATTSYNKIFNNNGFNSNTYYTLEIPVSKQKIDISNIKVSDFINGDTCTISLDKK